MREAKYFDVPFGAVESAKVPTCQRNGQFRGMAFGVLGSGGFWVSGWVEGFTFEGFGHLECFSHLGVSGLGTSGRWGG